jgi:hypothetical protein
MDLMNLLSQHLLVGDCEKPWNTSVRVAGVPAEVRTKHLCLEHKLEELPVYQTNSAEYCGIMNGVTMFNTETL